jgi:hypothetical protein
MMIRKFMPTKVDDAFYDSFKNWPVTRGWQQELYNYIVLGYSPGSFHAAVFANDLYGAVQHSHELTNWQEIIKMCLWIQYEAPSQVYGSYDKVRGWLALSKDQRREILEQKGLLYTEKVIVWNILKESTT